MRPIVAPTKFASLYGGGLEPAGPGTWLRSIRRLIGVSALGLLLGGTLVGCAVGPDYHPPTPPIPENFAATSAASAKLANAGEGAADPSRWWHGLHDRELDSLINRAIAASPTLDIALSRVQQARAQEVAVIGTALPVLGGSEGGGLGTGSDLARGRAAEALVSAENSAGVSSIANIGGFDAAWQLDVFGKYRRAIEAAQYDVDAASAARNVVLIALIADVTRAYLDLRAFQMHLAVLREDIDVAQKYLNFVQERFNRGITNELDVTLAQRELAQLQAEVAPLVAHIDAARYVIAVLIGEFPENLGHELSHPAALPALPPRIRAGLPIELLHRRPDIVEAERQLAGATALVGVATADLFPQVAISGSLGWQQAPGWSPAPINPIWSLGPAIGAPLLDFGRLDALVQKSDFRTRELLSNYRQTVLNAVQEVDTAVDAYAAQQNSLRHLGDAVAAARRAVTLAQERFDRGLTDSLNVIDAQRQEFAIEQQYVAAQQNAAEQFVSLYRSLGGGWEDYPVFAPIPPPMPAIAAAFKRLIDRTPTP
jgi:NodT family efflux transporter outer membrane factor (OMF) lipoprotein